MMPNAGGLLHLELPVVIHTSCVSDDELDADDLAYEMANTTLETVTALPRQRLLGDFIPIALPQDGRSLCSSESKPTRLFSDSIDEWPKLETRTKPIADGQLESRMVSAWLGSVSTLDVVYHRPAPSPIGGWSRPKVVNMRRVPAWRRYKQRAQPEQTSSSRAMRASKACGMQESTTNALKVRGTSRRLIGKKSRNEAHERARRLAPSAVCGESEAAARRGRHAEHDAGLANMLNQGLSLQNVSASVVASGQTVLRLPQCKQLFKLELFYRA